MAYSQRNVNKSADMLVSPKSYDLTLLTLLLKKKFSGQMKGFLV